MAGVKEAAALAASAHAGQTDKAGKPYLRHCEQVAARTRAGGGNAEQVTAAWVHDTVEDTHITLAYLRDAGYSETVVRLVDTLSRRSDETYAQFVQRVAAEPLAVLIKLADLADNLDPSRRLDDGGTRVERYLKAWTVLTGCSYPEGAPFRV